MHAQLLHYMKTLHKAYRDHPALWAVDYEERGFQWVDIKDRENSVISFLRRADHAEDTMLIVCNFTPVPRQGYRVGVPFHGFWEEVLNSDAEDFGGSNVGNLGGMESELIPAHDQGQSLSLNLPPLGAVWLKPKIQ